MLPIAVMLLGGGVAKGQEPATLRLSLEEAQKYAVEHNYTMQNASLELQKAEYSKWQTIASMLPQVKAGFDYQNMCGYEMVMGGGGGLSGPFQAGAVAGVLHRADDVGRRGGALHAHRVCEQADGARCDAGHSADGLFNPGAAGGAAHARDLILFHLGSFLLLSPV